MLDILIIVPEITKGMKSAGSKALLKINNSLSILEYQINQLRKYHKKSKIHIITGFESDKIKKTVNKYKVNIIYNQDYLDTNQGKCLSLFLNYYNTKGVLIISNGVIFKNNPFDISDPNISKVFLIDKPKNNFNIGCYRDQSKHLNYLFFDMPVSWSECFYMSDSAVASFVSASEDKKLDQMYLFETINVLLLDNIQFNKEYVSKKDIMKINTIKDMTKAKNFI